MSSLVWDAAPSGALPAMTVATGLRPGNVTEGPRRTVLVACPFCPDLQIPSPECHSGDTLLRGGVPSMSATIVWRAVLISLLLTPWLGAQAGSAPTSTPTCNLDDGRQVYVRYNPVANTKERPSNGKPWTPGGAPMTLFTEAQLSLGSSMIPIGAYSVYPIPAKDHWTLVVNKNVTSGSTYDEQQDIARTAMETAQV